MGEESEYDNRTLVVVMSGYLWIIPRFVGSAGVNASNQALNRVCQSYNSREPREGDERLAVAHVNRM
jgi:hypothetical protein